MGVQYLLHPGTPRGVRPSVGVSMWIRSPLVRRVTKIRGLARGVTTMSRGRNDYKYNKYGVNEHRHARETSAL
jgi:hypothetical protein